MAKARQQRLQVVKLSGPRTRSQAKRPLTHNYIRITTFFWKVEEKENERNSQQMTDQTPNRSCPEQQTSE